MTGRYKAFSTSTSNFPGQLILIQVIKNILTCLSNYEKIKKSIWVKCSRVSAAPQPPSWGWVMGSRISAECYPHQYTRTREHQCTLIAISLYLRPKPHLLPCGSISCTLTRRSLVLVLSLFQSSVVVNLHVSCPNSASVLSSCYSWYLLT